MKELQRRYERVAERILENERLTAGLDDEAAAVLLEWGLSWAGNIVTATTGMPEIEANEMMSPRLKANRRLMRYVNKWITGTAALPPDKSSSADIILTPYSVEKNRPMTRTKQLERIYQQARFASGSAARSGGTTEEADIVWQAFLIEATRLNGRPAEMIAQLRALLDLYLSDPQESTEQP